MANKKKATLDALIKRAEQSKQDKIKLKEFYCEPLGMVLTIQKPPVKKITKILDEQAQNNSIQEDLDTNIEVIYESIPLLHNKELQDAYDCVEPTDIVLAVLDENLGEIAKLANVILDMYGLAEDEVVDGLKN